MNGSSELTCPTIRKLHSPARTSRQQVERDVGVAAQAVRVSPCADALGDELRHDVDAALEHIAQRMGVVGGNIILLRERIAEPGAGQKEKFIDLDVRRQSACDQRLGVVEFGISLEQPVGEGIDKAALEVE